MISEPELEEQWEPGRPAEVAQGAGPPRERGPGRPWWWVVATAVATSAVWAGGLHFYGDRLAAPGLRHRATGNLCEQVKLPALGEALGGLSDTADPHMEGRHPAMDWAMCSRSGSTPAGEDAYFVQAEFELHKKTDPAAEFEVGSKYERAYSDEASVWEPVPGIGEQALISGPGADAEAGADTDRDLRLRVRDGGAVFVLQVVFLGEREPDAQPPEAQDGEAQVPVRPRPDRGTLKAAIVKDMRAMMAALEK